MNFVLSYHRSIGNVMEELVSCVLVTGNRNRFFPQALRSFSAQTYPHRELIVVDDGEIPVEGLCTGVEGVKYVRLDRRTPTGSKLNVGMELAAGTILQKIDDDDYYAPGFLATAAARVARSRLRRSIAGWDSFLILLASGGQRGLYFSGHGWLAGGTLCFRRQVWEAAPFRKIPANVDYYFLEDHPGPRLRVHAPEQYILVRHGQNTWRRFGNGTDVDDFFSSREPYDKDLSEVVAGEAARFYAGLTPSGSA